MEPLWITDDDRGVVDALEVAGQPAQAPVGVKPFVVVAAAAEKTKVNVRQRPRQVGEKRQAPVVGFDHLEPVGGAEIADPTRDQEAGDLGHQPCRIGNVLVHLIADRHVESTVWEGRVESVHDMKCKVVPLMGGASVLHRRPVDVDTHHPARAAGHLGRHYSGGAREVEDREGPQVSQEVLQHGKDLGRLLGPLPLVVHAPAGDRVVGEAMLVVAAGLHAGLPAPVAVVAVAAFRSTAMP